MADNPGFMTKFAIAQTVAAGSVTIAYPFDTVRRRLMMMSGEGEKMYKGKDRNFALGEGAMPLFMEYYVFIHLW